MSNAFSSRSSALARRAIALALGLLVFCSVRPAAAQSDQLYFSSNTDVTSLLVQYINRETVRLDISSWYLSEHSISIAIANRFAAGVPVRIIGDRGSMFEADPHTKTEFYWLANQGIPIRLRFNPSWFPEIDHWKMALFVGQNALEFGSGNFAPTELAPVCAQGATNCSPPNYDDDSEMFTTDPELVNAFKTKFDVMWNDTTTEPESIIAGPPYLKDWNDACANEPTGNCADYHTQYPNPAPMVINTARLEPDNPMPADLYWGQGPDFNNRLTQEINNENSHVDIVIYRLEVGDLAQALINKFNAGVPLRVIIDPAQYTSNIWPEYWLSHAYIDKLFAAGIPVKQRNHAGVTHMKTLITSAYATNASSNFGPNWQRDHDYFVSASAKPAIYQAFVNDFNTMWSDTTNFGPLVTTPPNAVDTSASGTVPSPGQSGVSVTTAFTWNTASWATSYDVYLGTSPSAMTVVANVAAQLVTNPPTTYSWTPPSALNFGTTYYWKIVSRTFANMTASSSIQSFSTPASGSQPPTAPSNPAPVSGAAGVGTSPTLTWTSAGATTYAINFGTTNPPPSTGTNTSAQSYSPGVLASNATYYWQIVATNGAGSTPGPIWSFATSASNLPAPWQSQDVGATGQVGSSIFGSGTYTIRGAGADIWGASDAFQFGYQALTGDGTIIAHVTSTQNTSSSAKAAVMMRASVAANDANVILDVSPTGNIEFMSRATSVGSTSWLSGATQAVPVWLKLVRTGSTIAGSISPDGSTWTQVGSTTISLPSTIDAGLVVCSHDTSTLNTSTFDNVSVTAAGGGGGGQPPSAPASPSPANGAPSVNTSSGLTWSAAGATSYDVNFGTASPPPQVTSGQAAASYTPSLAASTTYFWQIVAHNSTGATSGPIWSFTTAAPTAPATDIVIYASDVPMSGLHGTWTTGSDATSPNSLKLVTPDNGVANTSNALAAPTDYVDVTFNANAGTPYTLWLRVQALNNSKSNDSLWVQFSDALANGTSVYPMNTTAGLLVNLATDSTGASDQGWGWTNSAYWLTQPATLTFSTTGTHTIRIQVREDGVQFDQIVLSPATYLNSAPGPASNDNTIVPKPAPPSPPATPASPSPANGATSVSTSSSLTWTATGATSYDVSFGTANPPPQVSSGQAAASYTPTLAANTKYFWQVVAHNSAGSATGAVWSFKTGAAAPPPPPAAPSSPSPATSATGVNTSSSLTWTAAGATSYDVSFGTVNPPPQVASGQAAATYTPSLTTSTTYFWQVVAHNSAGATTGPVWSFTTAGPAATNIVIYASDVPANALHGMWTTGSDPQSPNSLKLVTPDNGVANTNNALAGPTDYVDVTFNANAGTPYTLWMRLQALNNSKYNDSLWVQFSDALANGTSVYPLNTTAGLLVNLATDSTGSSDQGWGWTNSAYWLSQPATLTFSTSGSHTIRVQIREDGIQFDQIVLSPTNYLNAAPGPVSNDSTIVPKP